MMRNAVRLFALCGPVLLVGGLAVAQDTPGTPTWTCWEHALTSSRAYDNPLLDVVLSVQYTSPTKKTSDCYGFWDGEGNYRIRLMFNEVGTWAWSTTCSDTGNRDLHTRSGTVEVTAYEGTNPLYTNGYLQVSDNRRYLVHANGKPFLWIGDTAWTANRYATDRYQFVKYLVARYAGSHVILSPEQDCGGRFGDADPHTAGAIIDRSHPFLFM
jgi:hypothetical protein